MKPSIPAPKGYEWSKVIKPTIKELRQAHHKWTKWYAWRPVRDIRGNWHWLEEVYRLLGNTYVDHDDWRWYYYGTVLDVLNND